MRGADESRQYQARGPFVFPAGHGVLLLASGLQEQYAHLLTKELDEKAAKVYLRRQFLNERAAKHAADILEASQAVEHMWTEEQELLAVRKESVVRASVFRQVCRFAALAVVLTSVAFHLARHDWKCHMLRTS